MDCARARTPGMGTGADAAVNALTHISNADVIAILASLARLADGPHASLGRTVESVFSRSPSCAPRREA
jgi:hypothetical protein